MIRFMVYHSPEIRSISHNESTFTNNPQDRSKQTRTGHDVVEPAMTGGRVDTPASVGSSGQRRLRPAL
ncbi:MAG: hypothetical protein QNK37_35350 [Acidobacteriota bacterium]|nr:hypothetical protein [Acidobacteriota bacterium]